MQWIPYWIFGASAAIAIAVAAIFGGWFWITPVIILPIVGAWVVVDTRLKRREGAGERAAARAKPE